MDVKMIEKLYGEQFAAYECSADEKMRFLQFPPQLAALLGQDPAEGEKIVDLWSLIAENELETRREMLLGQLEEGDIELVLPIVRGDGCVGWFLNRGKKIGDTVTGILVSMSRIKSLFDRQSVKLNTYKTRLEQTITMVDSLQVQAEQDSLTKLYNADTTRRLCSEYLRESGHICAVIMLDLDGFKQVNDALGHMEGDRVLTQMADAVRALFRAGDVIGRVGGDEFLILMKDIPSADVVRSKCATVVATVSELLKDPGCPRFGCSAGAVVTYTGSACYDSLFCRADQEMYSAKNSGGSCYSVQIDL